MSKPTKVGNKWRARVRKNGQQRSRNFSTKRDAELWIKQTEIEIETGTIAPKMLDELRVSQVIRRYVAEVLPTHKSPKRDETILNATLRNYPNLFNKPISKFGRLDVVAWKEAREKKVSSSSVLREWSSLGGCFTHAIQVWGLPIKNPFHQVKRPEKPKPRTRRISDKEIEMVKAALKWHDENIIEKRQYVAWCFLFAIETACRIGEICKLTWADIRDVGNGKIAHLKDTKNGTDRRVPLNKEARRLLAMLPRDDEGIVPMSSPQVDALFRKHRPEELRDLHFHDTRREALSRMAKRIPNPMDLAKISGHKDLHILMNTYYKTNDDYLVDLLD